jgi:chromosome segregation ATPase
MATQNRSPWLTALINPLNLAMLALVVAAGLCSAWWLLPLGLLLWVVMVVGVARDPSLVISSTMESRAPLAARFQAPFDRIERSQVSLFNALAAADPRIRGAFRQVQAETDGLVNQAYLVCQRMSALENYRLVTQAGGNLDDEVKRLQGQVAGATDSVVKREYEQSLASLQDRVNKLHTAQTQLDRVEAELSSLASQMDAALTEVVRIQSLGPNMAPSQAAALAQTLHKETVELAAFEKEVGTP